MDHPSAVPLLSAEANEEANRTQTSELTWLNRRLLDLLMKAPSAIGITVGPEHRWAYVNHARIKMAGRGSAQDFIGKTVRESYRELEKQPFFAALDEAYQTGVPFVGKEVKATFNRGPGGAPDEAYVDCVYQPIIGLNGEVEGLLIHTVEVTEQVGARRAIEEANQREQHQRAAAEFERNQLRELFKQAPAGIAILSGQDHRWSFANSTYCELVGRTREQLLGLPIAETLPELAGQGFLELLDQVYASGVPYIGKNTRVFLNRVAGETPQEAYFDFVYQPVRNIDGQIEGIMALAVDVSEQVQARTKLESRVDERTLQLQGAHQSLRLLSGRLMRAQDEEHRRLARDLHDSVGQYLAAIQMNLKALAGDSANSSDRSRHRLEDAVDLVDRCTAEIRTISYLLHPPLLDEVGLASAISWYVEGFSERSGIRVELNLPKDLPRFPSEMDTALFRIVQQSLANVHKHSGSNRASIRVAIAGANLVVEISDQGRGMSPEVLSKFRAGGQSPGVGISGMRERVLGLRGSFEIKSERSGTTIVVSVPIPEQA